MSNTNSSISSLGETICNNCRRLFTGPKCEKCIFISATEEVDKKFDKICKEAIVRGIELINDKKISGK